MTLRQTVGIVLLATLATSLLQAFLTRNNPALQASQPSAPQIIVREQIVEERVLDLPEDGDQWHTTLFLRPEWKSLQAERRAEAMFHSEPLLISLKHQTHWHLTLTSDAEFGKFASLVDVTPCLLIQRANGQVVYRESGPELGKHPHSLTHAIRKQIQRHCPDGKCLPLHPLPGPDNSKDEVPTVLLEQPPAADKKSPLAGILMSIAALGGGAFAHAKKTG